MTLKAKLLRVRTQIPRRYRQVIAITSNEGWLALLNRVRITASKLLAPKDLSMPVRIDDVINANETGVRGLVQLRARSGAPVVVNWVMTPPGPGSGGHTTLFRIINHLEQHGYVNRLYFYDVYGCDEKYYQGVVRQYYGFEGPVVGVQTGMQDADAVVATAWPTAYAVRNSPCAGKRFYFVQDFEPYFYPAGSLQVLAENTYSMGFFGITAGRWLAEKLRAEYGMETEHFDFGCDVARYMRLSNVPRSGVVFYARPDAARRGTELGLLALQIFANRHPDVVIHVYGQKMGKLPFSFVDHGLVRPEALNKIYNQCYAGLSLSLTNVSLVPHEMLAAGCIPVVNDATQNRMVLNNSCVRYAPPNPQALASALEAVVTAGDFAVISNAASASVHLTTWQDAGATVDETFKRALGSVAAL